MKKYLIKYYLLLKSLPFYVFVKKPNILSFEETVMDIVNNEKSVARFGDGEIRMALDEGAIGFQGENQLLSKRLKEIVTTDRPPLNLLICLPDVFRLKPENKLDSQIFWLGFNYLYSRRFIKLLPTGLTYGDTGITRFYQAYRKGNKEVIGSKVNLLKRIWHQKDLLIVEGEHTKLGINNNLFENAASIKRIICPAKNAFEQYDGILEATKEYGKNRLILIALGPTATVLAYDLAVAKYLSFDIGHIDIEYMWFLNGATQKEAIVGKYVNEATDQNTECIVDNVYESQIITIIK